MIIFKKAEVQERKMLAESFVSIGSNCPGSQLHMHEANSKIPNLVTQYTCMNLMFTLVNRIAFCK